MVLILLLFCMPIFAFVYHPFDDAMQADAELSCVDDQKMYQYLGVSACEVYTFFKQAYETQSAIASTKYKKRIPKIIHQIWIGKSLPKEFVSFQESCKQLHPDWEYKLWTQDDLPKLQLKNKQYIQQSRNPGEISDLLRYEILYQYGGVYLDCDIECVLALDELHELYDLYVGLQPLDTGYVQLGIGVIGVCPKHPMIQAAIEGIQETWDNQEYQQMATARTGPLYFTKIFLKYGDDKYKNIALPACYFYPLGSTKFDMQADVWRAMGAYTVHHWAKSWLLPSFRRTQFQSIKN